MTRGQDRYEYFACDGGPHLLLPSALASEWKGVENPDDVLDPTTDYGRACAASDEGIALLPVGDGHALVLGPNPPMTAWTTAPDGSIEVYIVETWSTGDLDALIDEARAAASWPSTDAIQWRAPEGGVVLMFAGDTVDAAAYGAMPIPLPAGLYRVERDARVTELGSVTAVRLLRAV
jgi:Immunity protein 21